MEADILTNTAVTNTVGASATKIINRSGSTRRNVLIQSLSTNTETVYVGGSDVTISTGIEIPIGKSISLETIAAVYAIRATADQNVRILMDRTN